MSASAGMDGRIAIVTGAAGGIGSAICRRFAHAGADICLVDIKSVAGVAAEVRNGGRRAVECVADVSRPDDVREMIATTLASFGRIDILVNVAGIVSLGPAESISEAEWDRVLAVNLKSMFLCSQAVIKPMRERRYGRIVNIGSLLAKNGGNPRPWIDRAEQARAGSVAYGASKAGVHALTHFFAKELAADGITVNAVAPGPIASAMTVGFPDQLRALIPAGRMGTADEVAEAVAFLAGENSSFITSEVLDVNGGIWGD